METKSFSFNMFNEYAKEGICEAIEKCVKKNKKPLFVCIGSDLVLGDSLGPLIGTKLKEEKISSYVYGTLCQPITAKEVEYAKTYIQKLHPDSVLIAIDAAVGNESDIGLIKVINKGLKPGLGVQKDLSTIGDISIIGVVAGKSMKNYNLYNLTRLNLIYKMTDQIVGGIKLYINRVEQKTKIINQNRESSSAV